MVVDASVAFKWIVPEADSHLAAPLAEQLLLAPDLILAEVANAIWANLRRGALNQVPSGFSALPQLFAELTPTSDVMDEALALAVQLRHPVYDCLYLALAIRSDLALITADQRFITAVAGSLHEARVVPLADWRA